MFAEMFVRLRGAKVLGTKVSFQTKQQTLNSALKPTLAIGT